MRIYLLIYITLAFIIIGYGQKKPQTNPAEKTRSEKWKEDLDYFENEYLINSKTFPKDSLGSVKLQLANLKKNN